MTKNTTIIGLGLLIASMPFLGFPQKIEMAILVIAGLLIASIAFVTHNQSNILDEQEMSEDRKTDMFVENGNGNGKSEKEELNVPEYSVQEEQEVSHEEETA